MGLNLDILNPRRPNHDWTDCTCSSCYRFRMRIGYSKKRTHRTMDTAKEAIRKSADARRAARDFK